MSQLGKEKRSVGFVVVVVVVVVGVVVVCFAGGFQPGGINLMDKTRPLEASKH